VKNFSFGLNNFANLLTTFYIQLFNGFFLKTHFLRFYSWGQRFFYIYGEKCPKPQNIWYYFR